MLIHHNRRHNHQTGHYLHKRNQSLSPVLPHQFFGLSADTTLGCIAASEVEKSEQRYPTFSDAQVFRSPGHCGKFLCATQGYPDTAGSDGTIWETLWSMPMDALSTVFWWVHEYTATLGAGIRFNNTDRTMWWKGGAALVPYASKQASGRTRSK